MRVVFNMQKDGTFHVVTDEPCEVFSVCDHCPNDRVYQLSDSHSVGAKLVDAELRNDVVGSSSDTRHAAISNRILARENGEKYLKPVEDEDDD